MQDKINEIEKSIDEAVKSLDPMDMKGLQLLMNAKRELKDLQKLHISIN